MKKLVYAVSAIILYFSQVVNAQITLDHTFDEYVTYNSDVDLYVPLYTNNNSNNIELYNTDYSLYKNILITPPEGYKLFTTSFAYLTPSRKFFNNDYKIEFFVMFQTETPLADYNNNYILKLYNEDGTVLKDFGNSYSILYPSFHIVNNQYRLSIVRYYLSGSTISYTTDIYSLQGTSAGVNEMKSVRMQQPYPNPANSVIVLPYQLKQGESSTMRIYDIQGKLIETKQIDSFFDKIMLNVSGYSQGLYLYEVNGVSNKFLVE